MKKIAKMSNEPIVFAMSPPLVVTPFSNHILDIGFLGYWFDPFFTELNLCCQYFVLLRDSIYIGKVKFCL